MTDTNPNTIADDLSTRARNAAHLVTGLAKGATARAVGERRLEVPEALDVARARTLRSAHRVRRTILVRVDEFQRRFKRIVRWSKAVHSMLRGRH